MALSPAVNLPSTYRFRLTAATRQPGLFRLERNETSFDLDGRKVFVVARNAEVLRFATKLHFESGGYGTKKAARNAGERLRLRLRVLTAMLGLDLNVPVDDLESPGPSAETRRAIEDQHQVTVLDHVWGLLIFPDDEKHVEVTMHGEAEVHPSDSEYWLAGISQLWENELDLDEQASEAIELLNLSSLEPSPRSKFLVTYLALEQLLRRKRRDTHSLDLLEGFKKRVIQASKRKRKSIAPDERKALVAALDNLKSESLASAVRRFAAANESVKIRDVPLADLLSTASKVRNRVVAHAGKLEGAPDFARLEAGLREVAIAIVWARAGIADFSLNRPPDQVTIEKGNLQIRLIAYKNR